MAKIQKSSREFSDTTALRELIALCGNAHQAAKMLHISASALYEQMARRGIASTAKKDFIPAECKTDDERKAWLEGLLKEHGSVKAAADAIGRDPSTIHDRLRKFGIHSPYKSGRIDFVAVLAQYKAEHKLSAAKKKGSGKARKARKSK